MRRRRDFIRLLGGAAAAWPLMARAQQPEGKIATIGILAIEPWPPIDTFDELIRQLGKSLVASLGVAVLEAKVLALDMPEIIESPSDVILTWGTDAVLAAKQATTTIPIVMGTVGDPLGSGIVTNLAHPDANVTRIVLPRCRA
jgi:putative ABC transport system substrate-binding protein